MDTTETLVGAPGAPPRPAAPAPGAARPPPDSRLVLGRYRLDRRLGSGGYGAVWLARDESLRRHVAVKVVPVDRAGGGDRGEREALAAARLNHPGIVTLYEAGADDGAHYLVSELVEGATLAEAIGRGALSDRDVLRIGVALCDALAHAHARGVVHRDIKPQNVIVPRRPQSEAGVAKLTDFGVAQLAGGEPLTRTGDIVGTLAYMAPEQAEGRRVDAACDVYAAALVIYEALTGNNPLRAASPAATARRVGAGVPPLRRLRRDLPVDLAVAIDRALERRPEQRATLGELRAGLEEALPEASDAGGQLPAAPRPLGGAGRSWLATRLWAGLAAGALVAAAAQALAHPPIAPVLAGACVAVGVGALPRLAWLAAAGGALAWLAVGPLDEPGTALIAAAGLGACPLLLPRAGRLWSLPGAALLLGAGTLAGAFPALAGQIRGLRRRAMVGALGFWWLALGELLSGRSLYLGPVTDAGSPHALAGSPSVALGDGLVPLIHSGLLGGTIVWALAAVVLPWLVRGRRLVADAVGAMIWAAALLSATAALAGALGSEAGPRGAIGGAGVGAALAVALAAARRGAAQSAFP